MKNLEVRESALEASSSYRTYIGHQCLKSHILRSSALDAPSVPAARTLTPAMFSVLLKYSLAPDLEIRQLPSNDLVKFEDLRSVPRLPAFVGK